MFDPEEFELIVEKMMVSIQHKPTGYWVLSLHKHGLTRYHSMNEETMGLPTDKGRQVKLHKL